MRRIIVFRQITDKVLIDNRLEQDALFEAMDELKWDEKESINVQIPLATEVEQLEKDRIVSALALHKGNRTRTADHLGIGRTLLLHKLKKYELV
tara:strand:- start:221 stop:502 length:282 start_codon:yes stop_codon:yes gene_type:complete